MRMGNLRNVSAGQVLEVPKALVKGKVVATSYGWGVFAMISTYTAAEVRTYLCVGHNLGCSRGNVESAPVFLHFQQDN